MPPAQVSVSTTVRASGRSRWIAGGFVCATIGALAVCAAMTGLVGCTSAHAQKKEAPAPAPAKPSGGLEMRDAPAPYYGPADKPSAAAAAPAPAPAPTPTVAAMSPPPEAPAPSVMAPPPPPPMPSADSGEKLAWATEYASWLQVTGYMISRSHGLRLVSVRVTPREGAEARVFNAQTARHLKDNFEGYPVGTMIAMPTWDITGALNRGAPGPIFFMRKEAPGYDPDGGDWRYAMTRPDLSVLAEGKDGKVSACRSCHLNQRARDFVPAQDR